MSKLEEMGMLGTYGFYEALDCRARAATSAGLHGVVRSYMAHHQGMILVALGNFLSKSSMVDRFHRDPLIETGEALLNECAPVASPTESLLPKRPRTPGSSVRTGTPTAPAATDGVAVVADAVLEEEVAIGIGGRQALGGAAIGDQEAAGQARQKALGGLGEAVG